MIGITTWSIERLRVVRVSLKRSLVPTVKLKSLPGKAAHKVVTRQSVVAHTTPTSSMLASVPDMVSIPGSTSVAIVSEHTTPITTSSA